MEQAIYDAYNTSNTMYQADIFGEKKDVVINRNVKMKFTYHESKFFSKEENEVINAIENILYWFFHQKKSFIIQGAAGTGKTEIIKRIIALKYSEAIYICAPTNKAVAQFGKLESILDENKLKNCRIKTGTLQKGLGLRVDIDDEGNHVYEITGQGELFKNSYNYLIIDEASMVSKEQYYTALSIGIPVLFIGDKNQLPPVTKSTESIFSVYDFFDEEHTYYIKEKKRFANERIKDLSKEIENAIEQNISFDENLVSWLIKYNDVLKGTLKMPENADPYYIDYTNKGGYFYWLNKHRHYYIEKEKYYVKGQVKGLKKTEIYTLQKIEKEHFIKYNNQEIKIKLCTFTDEQGEEIKVWAYNPNEEDVINVLKKKIRIMKKRTEMVLDMFADLTPLCKEHLGLSVEDYVIVKNSVMLYPNKIYTVHASQGSSFDDVLINIGSFKYIKDVKHANTQKLKLFYVAVTRSKNNIYYKI